MAGLFRRLRLRKPKEEGEEDAAGEPPADEASGDADIYPHRGPGVEEDPDIVGEPEPAPTDGDAEIGPAAPSRTAEPTSPQGVESSGPTEAAAPPTTLDGPALEVPLSTGPPPRLPEADEAAGGSPHRPLAGSTRCFLCGSEMSGSFCPTCRMTWND